MNQALADVFLAMPSALRSHAVFGTLCVLAFAVGFGAWLRFPFKDVLTRLRERQRKESEPYALHATVLVALLAACLSQGASLGCYLADASLSPLISSLLRTIVTLALGFATVAYLAYQPKVTVERRLRWGFARGNAVVHAALWEIVVLAVFFLWLYDAWFLPAFVTI